MNVRRTAAALTSAAALSVSGVVMATPAVAAPTDRAVTQTGGAAAGLIAALVQVNDVQVVSVRDTEILRNANIVVDDVIRIGDVNVDVQDVLNNNRILQNFLNRNDVDVNIGEINVVDLAIVGDTLFIITG